MHIRRLREADLEQVCALEEEAFSMPWKRGDFVDMINNTNALYLVAAEGETVLGCAGCICVLDEGNICNIVVKSGVRGQGVGSALIKELILQGSKEYGIASFTLEVRAGNMGARRFYERHGFEFEGMRPGFYDLPKEDGAIYWLRNVEV